MDVLYIDELLAEQMNRQKLVRKRQKEKSAPHVVESWAIIKSRRDYVLSYEHIAKEKSSRKDLNVLLTFVTSQNWRCNSSIYFCAF